MFKANIIIRVRLPTAPLKQETILFKQKGNLMDQIILDIWGVGQSAEGWTFQWTEAGELYESSAFPSAQDALDAARRRSDWTLAGGHCNSSMPEGFESRIPDSVLRGTMQQVHWDLHRNNDYDYSDGIRDIATRRCWTLYRDGKLDAIRAA